MQKEDYPETFAIRGKPGVYRIVESYVSDGQERVVLEGMGESGELRDVLPQTELDARIQQPVCPVGCRAQMGEAFGKPAVVFLRATDGACVGYRRPTQEELHKNVVITLPGCPR